MKHGKGWTHSMMESGVCAQGALRHGWYNVPVPQGYCGRSRRANQAPPLTVLRVIPAAAVAANVLDLLPDVTVDRKGHVVVVLRILAVPLLVAQRHDFDQAERLFLGLLHRHGRVFSAPRGKPGAVHDGGRGVHRRVIGRLEHYRDAERRKKEGKKRGWSASVRGDTTVWTPI